MLFFGDVFNLSIHFTFDEGLDRKEGHKEADLNLNNSYMEVYEMVKKLSKYFQEEKMF